MSTPPCPCRVTAALFPYCLLSQNISLSALRKTERMSRGMAAAKMTLTAGRSLLFQNLALFVVDELFLSIRLCLRERYENDVVMI